MNLQRSTWVWLAIAMVLGTATVVVVKFPNFNKPAAKPAEEKLFAFADTQLVSLQIKTADGQDLSFEKTARELKPWQMIRPKSVMANDAAIAYLLDLVAQRSGDKSFNITADQLPDYGLDKPYGTVIMTLQDKHQETLTLGATNFENTFIYGRKNQELKVWLLPTDFQYAVTRKLSEWQDLAELKTP